MLLNAACREGRCAAASTHPPASGLAAAKPLAMTERPMTSLVWPHRLRSARAHRGGERATHPPALGLEPLRLLWRACLVGASTPASVSAWSYQGRDSKGDQTVFRSKLHHRAATPQPLPPDEGAAASSSAAAGGGAASAGSEQGTKRKRDGPSDDDDESGAREEGGEDAAPLC